MSLIKIVVYTTSSGRASFSVWLNDLDVKTRAIIKTRLDRIRLGNFGDSKPIKNGAGVKELRISYGPGYRIYYGMKGSTLVILLVGGDKKSQARDITKAKQYWLDVKELL